MVSMVSARDDRRRVGRPRGARRRWRTIGRGLAATALTLCAVDLAEADPQIVAPSGLPVQVIPTYPEPGLPAFNFQSGGFVISWRRRLLRRLVKHRGRPIQRGEPERRGIRNDDGSELGGSGGSGGERNGRESDRARRHLRDGEQLPERGILRAVYQFGAGVGPDVAAADDSDNIAALTHLTPAQLAADGLSTSSTVVKGLGYSDNRGVLDWALEFVSPKYSLFGPLILDAANFGAATRRPRLFVIGLDLGRCDQICAADLEAVMARPATVQDAISDLACVVRIEDDQGFDCWKIRRKGPPTRYASALRTKERTFAGHMRTAHSADVIDRFMQLEQGAVEAIGRHPRLHWDGQCPTLRAGTGRDHGKHPSVRPIRPEEPRSSQ
jgi:hypothetical protein